MSEAAQRKLTGGLYLVVDPMPGIETVLPKVKAALEGGVDVIQLWNHWRTDHDHKAFIPRVCELAQQYNVPVLINEHWQWLQTFPLDGIHFDTIPRDWPGIKEQIGRNVLIGITCGNEEHTIQWAIDHSLSYVSFCSLFPSVTANSCELVAPSLVQRTCSLVNMPVFVAGGITCDAIPSLQPLGISGVAIASGIIHAADPQHAASQFKQALQHSNTLR